MFILLLACKSYNFNRNDFLRVRYANIRWCLLCLLICIKNYYAEADTQCFSYFKSKHGILLDMHVMFCFILF